MKKIKSSVFIILVFVSIVSILFLSAYFSDNRNTENLPDEVITLKFEFTNLFLIPISHGYILIDNAYEKEFKKFIDYLDVHKIDIDEIKYILLTHHHDDHVGFLNQITSANPDVSVVLHRNTADLVATGFNNKNNGGGILNRRIFVLFKIKQVLTPEWDLSFPPYFVRENDLVFDNDVFDLSNVLGIDIKAIYTPGHSSDSFTYIYNNKYAFCGDLSSNFLNWAGASYLTLFNENINSIYDSWRSLINRDIEVIIPSHGKPFNIINLKNNIDLKKQENIIEFF
jgi:glyoxylase-like metal-dependent hydrolase (beta-lactamase superfamily II)